MTTTIDNIKEEIELGVDSIAVEIPVRLEMNSINNAPFEFTTSIDDLGQIILTPTTKEMEFISAETDSTVEFDVPVKEQETIVTTDGNLTTKRTSVIIRANMLAESDNHAVSADVDEIGQVVLYPLSKENSFISVSQENSLNLITESSVEMEEYCDYKIINPGDGWHVKSPKVGLIGDCFDNINAAKIFVCETEIDRLSALMEEVKTTDLMEDATESEDSDVNSVSAEFIEESVSDASVTNEFTDQEVTDAVVSITEDYTLECGVIKCDTLREGQLCQELLKQHYPVVLVDLCDSFILINFVNSTPSLNEETTKEVNKADIIDKFLRGELTLLSDTGIPVASYEHISELDHNGYEYYYDTESGVMVSYPSGVDNG